MMKMNLVMIALVMWASCLLNTTWLKQRVWMSLSFDRRVMALREELTPACTGTVR